MLSSRCRIWPGPTMDAASHSHPFSLRADPLLRMFSLALLAVAAYVATNIDNLFVLLAFLAEAEGERHRVIVGQIAGSLTLVVGSILLAAMLTRLPAGYVGLLGILPIGVGLSKVWERLGPARARQEEMVRIAAEPLAKRELDSSDRSDSSAISHAAASAGNRPHATRANSTRSSHSATRRRTSWWTVACIAVANGSDNLAVYVPLYASHSHTEAAFISLVFVVMIGLWCAGAVWLVAHPLLGAPIRRYGTVLLPLVLVIIGVSVIAQNDTLRIVFGV